MGENEKNRNCRNVDYMCLLVLTQFKFKIYFNKTVLYFHKYRDL